MAQSTTGARRPLTRERIYAAALAIIDAEGLPALSMRKLGSSLGVEAMAIYHHVPNKDALLDGVADSLLAQSTASPSGLTWRQGMHWSADALRGTLRAHPSAVALVTARAGNSRTSVQWTEGPLSLLTDTGFTAGDSVGLLHATLALIFGWTAFESAGSSSTAQTAASADMAAVAPTAWALESQMSDWSGGFDRALDALFDSWERRLPPGSKGAMRSVATAPHAASGSSAWIVEKGGDDKGHKKSKKKKAKAKKKL